MILDITQDPQWLEQRTRLWLEKERDVSDGLTRKEVKPIKDFFFTGIATKNSWIKATGMLGSFPVFTVEGLAWCLQAQVEANLSNDEYDSIQNLFAGRLYDVPGLSCEERISIFHYVFGAHYDPNRLFPFLLGNETQCRPMNLHVNLAYSYLINVSRWLDGDDEPYAYMASLMDYFFSLILFVDEKIFQLEDAPIKEWLPGRVILASCQSRLRKLMRKCFSYPKGIAVEGEAQRRYSADFRERMDNLEHYPGELKQLWESIKAEHA
ncbi:MAG TPA: hypothetical protein VJA19_11825 [Pseudomonas sp.]|nr:hypothetical protein [Pseudomonas sp.]